MGSSHRERPGEVDLPLTARRQAVYRITVLGIAGMDCSAWLGAASTDSDDGTTTFTVAADQAALRGILCWLWDLNATLVAASRTPSDSLLKGDAQDE